MIVPYFAPVVGQARVLGHPVAYLRRLYRAVSVYHVADTVRHVVNTVGHTVGDAVAYAFNGAGPDLFDIGVAVRDGALAHLRRGGLVV